MCRNDRNQARALVEQPSDYKKSLLLWLFCTKPFQIARKHAYFGWIIYSGMSFRSIKWHHIQKERMRQRNERTLKIKHKQTRIRYNWQQIKRFRVNEIQCDSMQSIPEWQSSISIGVFIFLPCHDDCHRGLLGLAKIITFVIKMNLLSIVKWCWQIQMMIPFVFSNSFFNCVQNYYCF